MRRAVVRRIQRFLKELPVLLGVIAFPQAVGSTSSLTVFSLWLPLLS